MVLGGPLGISLAPLIKKHAPGLAKALKPIAAYYTHLAGYRQMGFKYDDIIVEENDQMQRALSRLTPRETYDRAFRTRVAFQQSILHKDLPKEQWVKPEDDVPYLTPHVVQVMKEDAERQEWDSATIEKQKVSKH